MAVVKNFWLRDNTQKLGGAVIYQVNGQTLMRQLAPAVSNPRTDAQMATRVRLANLVAFYRVSAKWMRGAFETKAANQSDYNAFVSANASANAVWLTKSQVAAGTCVVAPYVISRGSMGEIRQSVTATLIASNLYTGELVISGDTTIADLSSALIANNNGLQNGDQLSIIQYIQNTATGGAYSIVCRAYEVILSTTNTLPLSNYLPVDILTTTGGDDSALAILTASFVGGASFILSRTQGGRILVSTSQVSLTSNNTIYAAMTSNAQKDAAIRSYGSNTTVFLDATTAGTANGGVTTALQILQVLGPSGQNIASGGRLPVLSTGQSIVVKLSEPVDMAEYVGALIQYQGESDSFDLTATPATGETAQITLTAQESTDRDGNSADDPGYIEVIIGENTLRWNITTERGEGLG